MIIEHNIIRNGSATGIKLNAGERDVIIRNNRIERMGLKRFDGEAIYIGTAPAQRAKRGGETVRNIHIYGNVLDGFTENGVDVKSNTEGVVIRHNVIENQTQKIGGSREKGTRNEGVITLQGRGHYVHDNIIRNAFDNTGLFHVSVSSGHRVINNVITVTRKTDQIIVGRNARGGGTSSMIQNVFCNLSSRKVGKVKGIQVSDNAGLDAPAQDCDARVQEILSNMRDVPPVEQDVGGTFVSIPVHTRPPPVPCHRITPGRATPSGWGTPYSLHSSTRDMLVRGQCHTDVETVEVIVGTKTSLVTYVWPTIYYWVDGERRSEQLICENRIGQWCVGEGVYEIPRNEGLEATWAVGWVCQWDGRQWRCGCTDAACRTSNWQAQQMVTFE